MQTLIFKELALRGGLNAGQFFIKNCSANDWVENGLKTNKKVGDLIAVRPVSSSIPSVQM